MKALITGGAGFVGSAVAIALRKRHPHAVILALDNLKRRGSEINVPRLREQGVVFAHGDIRNTEDLAAVRDEYDILIDASAEPSVHAGTEGTPEYVVATNLMGTFNCLNFARQCARKFILLSTSRVYSIDPLRRIKTVESPTRFEIAEQQIVEGVSNHGISERFPTDTSRSFYGTSKLAAEYLTQEFVEWYGLKALILRCSVIAGPGQFGKVDQGVFTLWVAHHYFKRELHYTGFGGSGKQVRDLLHINDLCSLVMSNLERDVWPRAALNIGGGFMVSTSMLEFTEICREVVGNTVPVGKIPHTTSVDVPLFISDCRRAQSELGWKPIASVRNIVADTFEWIRRHETELKGIFT